MKYKITNEHANKRLDSFLVEVQSEFTRSHFKNLIVDGKITVNGKPLKSGYSLKAGDEVFVPEIKPEVMSAKPQNIPLDILYQDEDFAIINKPKGMVVHPAVKNIDNTLVNALLYNIKDLSGINGVLRPGIVHRLDKDTSGLLVVAKNDLAHAHLSKQISEKNCRRIYLGVVEGHLKEGEGVVSTNIERSKKNRLKMAVSDKGKFAETHYKVLASFDAFDLVMFELKTGRTHQIRVHCEYLHHPLLGDKLYGAKKEKYFVYGQFLHAYKLILTHPTQNKIMEFTSFPPDYFVSVLTEYDKNFNLNTIL